MSDIDNDETCIGRGFTITHQKVMIDVDFINRNLRGCTEMTIVPTDPLLRKIRINSYDCDIISIHINEIEASFEYLFSKNELKLYKRSSVHQHHLLRKKFEAFHATFEYGNLSINIPKSIKIESKKNNETCTQTEEKEKDPNNSNDQISTKGNIFSLFLPIVIKINYSVKNPSTGLNFVGCDIDDNKYPHVFTTHVPISAATSNWLPCIEGIWDRCTWDFEITVPKTLRDMWILSDSSKSLNGNHVYYNNDTIDNGNLLNEPNDHLEFKVICIGDQLDEFTTPENNHKKTVCFSLGSLVSSQFVSFAVGPFDEINLTNFCNTDKDDTMGCDSVEVLGYCLPGRVLELRNSCMFIYKAIDFFVREYGSYPYNVFKLCFVDDHPTSAVPCASMVIANNNLLFPPDIVDPIYSTTRILTFALANQWIGVNIVPKHWNDIWLTIGLAYYITDLFLCKLMGNNDYRFRLKKAAEKVCEEDIGRPALTDPKLSPPIDPFSIEFISLKAPVVLYILEKRLTKSGPSWGLSRIIPKLFLQAMGGNLINNTLSTSHFLKVSEKVSRISLDIFAQQWIHGQGYPRLRIIQRFNRKKMLIEIGIRQVQDVETPSKPLTVTSFFDDAKYYVDNISNPSPLPVFTGTMTIRIHEADGTPYDHVVEIKEAFTKLDIQYNIKNKKLRKNQSKKQKKDIMDIDGLGDIDNDNDFGVQYFGNILQSEQEMKDWKLEEWPKEDEEKMSDEAFEWIRFDADFEWICLMWVNQPDYMYFSQLRQDRDVIAQYEAVQYFSNCKANSAYSTILLRTLMDSRYYYGIRCEAALALVKCATEELNWVGWFHLFKAFQTNYCFPNSSISKSNNFSNLSEYYIQCIIPVAMSKIRDKNGNSLTQVKKFLADLLRYNDNSTNKFSDSYYICTLINSLASTLITENKESFEYNFNLNNPENKSIIETILFEIERLQKIDQLLPSFQNIISITSLKIKYNLSKAGIILLDFQEVLRYTRLANYSLVRLTAFDILLKLGGLRQGPFTRYVFSTIFNDKSPIIRRYLSYSVSEALALMALNDQQNQTPVTTEQMIIEDDIDKAIEQKKKILVRANISGAITALRQEVMEEETLKEELWACVNSDKLDYVIRLNFLNIISLLFDPKESRVITLKIPNSRPRLTAQIIGEGKLIIRKEIAEKEPTENKKLPKIKIKISNIK
ncbi:hypothetical protein PNEG_00424 [Pneumocystis murina B123]|uniref:Transcription initiation factor TFIID subunit 2 n=1 Tax=Pneumocystis murina (strain B123) TaxID=1069680 RepID=M7NW90_PNEMU|nr:hypothetical protein PNEG_00424 [Pneumocystis murina B123]EMR11401.1 hypothetical protein PNEG_00424 [Pneumocystis murina B123]